MTYALVSQNLVEKSKKIPLSQRNENEVEKIKQKYVVTNDMLTMAVSYNYMLSVYRLNSSNVNFLFCCISCKLQDAVFT